MPVWLICVIAAAAVAAIGILIFLYGRSRFEAGVATANEKQSKAIMEKNDEARKQKEQIAEKVDAIPDSDLDDRLADLGILRRD